MFTTGLCLAKGGHDCAKQQSLTYANNLGKWMSFTPQIESQHIEHYVGMYIYIYTIYAYNYVYIYIWVSENGGFQSPHGFQDESSWSSMTTG